MDRDRSDRHAKSFDGSAEVVRSLLGHDPVSSSMFAFRNKNSRRLKILWWDRDGLAIYDKPLEHGAFRFLSDKRHSVGLDGAQLLRWLDGLEVIARRTG